MTASDLVPFSARVRDLAKARGRDLEPDVLRGVFALLADLPLSDVLRGTEHSVRHDRYFPDPVAIRRAVKATQPAQSGVALTPEMAAALAQGERHCVACDDTGWHVVERDCTSLHPGYYQGATRAYAAPCGCRGTNPLYQAKRRAETRRTASGDGGGE